MLKGSEKKSEGKNRWRFRFYEQLFAKLLAMPSIRKGHKLDGNNKYYKMTTDPM